jgi:hypothetical protein
MNSETEALLKLTEQSYDEYNNILPVIKGRLGEERTQVFEQVLKEELPLTTGRRAFQAAIKVAMGEPNVYREYSAEKISRKPKKKSKN